MPILPALGSFPKRAGDLDIPGLAARVRCPRCGRVADLDVKKLKADHDRMPLTELLARLQCNETRDHRKCGGRPDALEIVYRPPRSPYDEDQEPRVFTMDASGAWHAADGDSGPPLEDAPDGTRLQDLAKGRYLMVHWGCCDRRRPIGPGQATQIPNITKLSDLWRVMPCPKCGRCSTRTTIEVNQR